MPLKASCLHGPQLRIQLKHLPLSLPLPLPLSLSPPVESRGTGLPRSPFRAPKWCPARPPPPPRRGRVGTQHDRVLWRPGNAAVAPLPRRTQRQWLTAGFCLGGPGQGGCKSPTQLHDDPRRGPAINSLLLHGELEPRKMARRPAAVALLRRHEPPGTGRWRGGQRRGNIGVVSPG